MYKLSRLLLKGGGRSALEGTLLRHIKDGNHKAATDELVSIVLSRSAIPPIQPQHVDIPVTPNMVALVLHACDASSDIDGGNRLISSVMANVPGFVWDSKLASLVIRFQCRAGQLDAAAQTFAWLVAQGEVRHRSWAPYLRGVATSICELADQHRSQSSPTTDTNLAFAATLSGRLATLQHLHLIAQQFSLAVDEEDFIAFLEAYANTGCGGEASTSAPLTILHQLLLLAQPHVEAITNGARVSQLLIKWAGTAMVREVTARHLFDTPRPGGSSDEILTGAECPHCRTRLVGHPYPSSLRTALLSSFHSTVIPNVCKSQKAPQVFEAFAKYIHTRGDANVYIDGANVGYYGLSSWYGVAKRRKMEGSGMSEDEIRRMERLKPEEFIWDAKKRYVDVPPSFELIDQVLTELTTNPLYRHYGFKPLVFLHRRHTEAHNLIPGNEEILDKWLKQGQVYCSPDGINDDLCWLYACFYHTAPTDSQLHGPSAVPRQVFIVTGDLMRDHLFALFDRKVLAHFRDRARIGFSCQFKDGTPTIHFKFPRPYADCFQFDVKSLAWHIPLKDPSRAVEPMEESSEEDSQCVQWLCIQ